MTVKSVKALILFIAALSFLALWLPCSLSAEEAKGVPDPVTIDNGTTETASEQATAESETEGTMEGEKTKSGYGNSGQFGGPKSVGAQLKTDDTVKKPLFTMDGLQRTLKPYDDFKRWVNEKIGLQFGGDYNVFLQDASQSMGENTAVGGCVPIFWPVGPPGTRF